MRRPRRRRRSWTSAGQVNATGQGGILGLAFHPQFASNGRFFVSYLANGSGGHKFEFRVSEFQGTPTTCNPSSEKPLVRVGKKRNTHQAGGLAFGPDGMLYVGIGDGMEKQPQKQLVSQQPNSLLGKILRMDVSAPGVAKPAAGNPWMNMQGVDGRIYAYGYRNPWRFDWDARGSLWTVEPGMKGPTSQEWIAQVVAGGNGRWPMYEGTRRRPEFPSEPSGKPIAPAFTYGSAQFGGGDTCGVAGKFYKGKRAPALAGKFVFCDYTQGSVMAIDLSSGRGTGLTELGRCKGPADIGADADGELYICAIDAGLIYTIAGK